MVIDPNILKNIKKVVFLKNEPTQTNVLWAKYEKANTYSFYLFYDGEWHPTDEITNITISAFSGNISAFVNDTGYLTTQDINGKLDKAEVLYKDVYIGTGAVYTDIVSADHHYENMLKGSVITVNTVANYLWVVLPQQYTPTVLMGGMEIPMNTQGSLTIESAKYKILKSVNSYTGTFNVVLI